MQVKLNMYVVLSQNVSLLCNQPIKKLFMFSGNLFGLLYYQNNTQQIVHTYLVAS